MKTCTTTNLDPPTETPRLHFQSETIDLLVQAGFASPLHSMSDELKGHTIAHWQLYAQPGQNFVSFTGSGLDNDFELHVSYGRVEKRDSFALDKFYKCGSLLAKVGLCYTHFSFLNPDDTAPHIEDDPVAEFTEEPGLFVAPWDLTILADVKEMQFYISHRLPTRVHDFMRLHANFHTEGRLQKAPCTPLTQGRVAMRASGSKTKTKSRPMARKAA